MTCTPCTWYRPTGSSDGVGGYTDPLTGGKTRWLDLTWHDGSMTAQCDRADEVLPDDIYTIQGANYRVVAVTDLGISGKSSLTLERTGRPITP